MKTRTVSKLFTVLMVLVMMLSATMVLQWSAKAEGNHVGSVEGIVEAQDGTYPAGIQVKLIDISHNKVITTLTENGGYFTFNEVNSGYHKIMIPSQSSNEEMVIFSKQTDTFFVEEGENVNRGFIQVDSAGLDYTVQGKVTDSKGAGIPETEITLTDTASEHMFSKSFSLDDEENGTYEFMTYDSKFVLKFDAPNYKPHTIMVDINESTELPDVTLKKKPMEPVVSGFLWETDGQGIKAPIDVTLYNESRGFILHEKISHGPYFEIGAVVGEYTMVVKAVGYEPHVMQIDVDQADFNLKKITVDPSEKETISTDIEIDSDWQGLTVTRKRTIQPGTIFEGIGYEYLGSIKMQIDFAFGNKDLSVSQTELTNFRNNWLVYREASTEYSDNMITVDDIDYQLQENEEPLEADLSALEGSVMDPLDEEILLTSTMEYDATEEISSDEDQGIIQHLIDFTAKNDYEYSNMRDYSYDLELPTGFERVLSEQEVIPPSVDVEGYTSIKIDPKKDSGESQLRFDVRKSEEKGDASIVLKEAGNVYLQEEDKYIVKRNSEVKGEAIFEDPISEAESYTWKLDGEEISTGRELTYTFDQSGTKELTIEIKDTGGEEVTDSVDVLVDGQGPQGEIVTKNKTGTETTTFDEGEEITFNASDFDDNGEIRDYEWNFTDGSGHKMGEQVTHVFDLHSTYEVKVNVTDVVGNSNMVTIPITVKDATDPVPSMKVINKDGEEIGFGEIVRKEDITFNASNSYDPAGYDMDKVPADELNITWILNGEEEEEGPIFSYEFKDIGQYTLKLDVEDQSGNNKSMTKKFSVSPGKAPNLEITQLKFSNNKPREGEKVTIKVNVTNYGSLDADDISVYVNDEIYDGTPTFFNNGEKTESTNIPEGQNRLIQFSWNVGDEGKKTISVNITDEEEPTSPEYTRDNSMEKKITVQPPAWREYIVYALIPIIIVGVSVGLYFYRERF